jgi:hypothetical protein
MTMSPAPRWIYTNEVLPLSPSSQKQKKALVQQTELLFKTIIAKISEYYTK